MIVLDTHALIWWQSEPKRLGKAAARSIAAAKSIGVPAFALWEVAALSMKKRVRLKTTLKEWIDEVMALPRVAVLPLSPDVIVRATQLGAHFHSDPGDRLIVATALVEGAPLVSADTQIEESGVVRVIW